MNRRCKVLKVNMRLLPWDQKDCLVDLELLAGLKEARNVIQADIPMLGLGQLSEILSVALLFKRNISV
jgi:hypothetical protein